jgi:hypothetical protein
MHRLECTALFGWSYDLHLQESQQTRSKPGPWLSKHAEIL